MPVTEQKPGPELNMLIAEKVMEMHYSEGELAAPYSTDIAAAWKVVEKMDAPEFNIIRVNVWDKQRGRYTEYRAGIFGVSDWWVSSGQSAAHAICLAALKARGHGS